jgi:hypothetical protein
MPTPPPLLQTPTMYSSRSKIRLNNLKKTKTKCSSHTNSIL